MKRDDGSDKLGQGADERDPAFWRLGAERLKRSADLAWAAGIADNGPGRHPTRVEQQLNTAFLFLAGLALEYLAMGCLLGEGSGAVDDVPGHRLRRLVQRCGIEPGADEQDLLRRAEAVLQWHSRFSIAEPMGDAALKETAPRLGGLAGMLTARHKSALDSLFVRLEAAGPGTW